MHATATTLDYCMPPAGIDTSRERGPMINSTTNVSTTTTTYSATALDKEFADHLARLQELAINSRLWVDGTEGPSALALDRAQTILQHFWREEMVPDRVVASAEGGVAICFVNGNKYGDLECLNAGSILGVVSNRRDRPSAWEVECNLRGVSRATVRLREFLYPSTPTPDAEERPRSR